VQRAHKQLCHNNISFLEQLDSNIPINSKIHQRTSFLSLLTPRGCCLSKGGDTGIQKGPAIATKNWLDYCRQDNEHAIRSVTSNSRQRRLSSDAPWLSPPGKNARLIPRKNYLQHGIFHISSQLYPAGKRDPPPHSCPPPQGGTDAESTLSLQQMATILVCQILDIHASHSKNPPNTREEHRTSKLKLYKLRNCATIY
jgi:hypothetical protein